MVGKCETAQGKESDQCREMAESAKYLGCSTDGVEHLTRCSADILDRYSSPNMSLESSLGWCITTYEDLHRPGGIRWDQLSFADRSRYESSFCHELAVHRRVLPCSSIWGYDLLHEWANRSHLVHYIKGASTVVCSEANPQRSQFCWQRRIVMDFSKSDSRMPRRKFRSSFIQTYGRRVNRDKYQYELLLPVSHTEVIPPASQCDLNEKRPVFVVSQGNSFCTNKLRTFFTASVDDVNNMAHHMNDVVMLWAMKHLTSTNFSESILLNIDGFTHSNQVAGVDDWGPFVEYFTAWFGRQNMRRAIEYRNLKVCFKELYFPAFQTYYWSHQIENRVKDRCSLQGPAPIYQAFNLYVRREFFKFYGTLPIPKRNTVLIIKRSAPQGLADLKYRARVITNFDELSDAIEGIDGVIVRTADLAHLPFDQQVKLVHSSSIILGMHGAGLTHIMNMAVGAPDCCALVELFPSTNVDPLFNGYQGYANMARWLGVKYFSYTASKSSMSGTLVDVSFAKKLVLKALKSVQSPICMNFPRNR